MAKKPPTQLQRIIMAADPRKAKEAIEFIKKQIAQGSGTPEQKKVMAEIDSLKTDVDKLAAYVTAKEEGRLEYDYKPQKGDVPRAKQEPWTKRDQRFYEGKAPEFNEPLTEEDFIRNRKPEPEVNKTRINYDDVAPEGLLASRVKQQGIPTVKAKEVALKGMAGQPEPSVTQEKSIKEQLLEREARNAKLKAEREAARSGIKEMVDKPVKTVPVEEALPEAAKAAEPETPKETKSKKGSRGKPKTAQVQADEAALSKLAGKPVVAEAPEVSEPVATDPRAKALGISDIELDERLERARKIASGETPVEAAPTVEATPKAAESETKTPKVVRSKKTEKPTTQQPSKAVTAEPTPSVSISEPELTKEPTVAEAETQAKAMRERFAQPAVETKLTAAPETVKQPSPKSGGFSLTPKTIQSGFKLAGRGLGALDVAQNLSEGDVGGAVVSGGLTLAPEAIGAVAGGTAGAVTAIPAGVLYPTKTGMDAAEEGINNLLKLYNTAKTPEEKATLKEVINRTRRLAMGASEEEAYAGKRKADREIIATTPDKQMIKEAQTHTRPQELLDAERIADKGLRSYNLLADFIGRAESGGDYNAVNKSSGAVGKYQILEKDLNGKDIHGKMVEYRYGMPFKQAMSDPAIQEDYFRNVLLPQYKKQAAELANTPEAKEKGLDEFTLTGMLQLGVGNVRKYLAGKSNKNISNQMEYFQNKAEKYKRSIDDEQAAILGLKEKERELQEQGKYIPYKSAEAKMDTARLGQVINRKDIDDLNARSEMFESYQKADPFVSRISPSQRRFQESETVTSDSFTPEQIRAAAISDNQEIPSQEKAIAKFDTTPTEEAKAAVEEPTTIPKPTITPTRERSRLEEALELQRQYEMLANISRGSERLGRGVSGAISGRGPSKMSEGEFEQSLSRMGKIGLEGAKLLEEEDVKKEESDPTSEKSKRARESLKSILGTDLPESLSYNDIKTLKFSDLSLKTGAAEAKKTEKEANLLTKAGDAVRKSATSLVKILDLQKRAKDALLKPNPSKDIDTLYGFIKALDENSAVREGELKLATSTLSKLSDIKRKMLGLTQGTRVLDQPTLKQINEIMDEIANQTQSNYNIYKKSIFAPLADFGISADRYEKLDPISYREQPASEPKEQAKPKIHPQSGIELYD